MELRRELDQGIADAICRLRRKQVDARHVWTLTEEVRDLGPTRSHGRDELKSSRRLRGYEALRPLLGAFDVDGAVGLHGARL